MWKKINNKDKIQSVYCNLRVCLSDYAQQYPSCTEQYVANVLLHGTEFKSYYLEACSKDIVKCVHSAYSEF